MSSPSPAAKRRMEASSSRPVLQAAVVPKVMIRIVKPNALSVAKPLFLVCKTYQTDSCFYNLMTLLLVPFQG